MSLSGQSYKLVSTSTIKSLKSALIAAHTLSDVIGVNFLMTDERSVWFEVFYYNTWVWSVCIDFLVKVTIKLISLLLYL